jgi:hypothetical protein
MGCRFYSINAVLEVIARLEDDVVMLLAWYTGPLEEIPMQEIKILRLIFLDLLK